MKKKKQPNPIRGEIYMVEHSINVSRNVIRSCVESINRELEIIEQNQKKLMELTKEAK